MSHYYEILRNSIFYETINLCTILLSKLLSKLIEKKKQKIKLLNIHYRPVVHPRHNDVTDAIALFIKPSAMLTVCC